MRRRFFAPECLQISSMDCGVAAVSTLLQGYGVSASYERLRELCQTGVDGSSIDSLEDLCHGFGVEVVQHIVPPDLASAVMEGRFPLVAIVSETRRIPHFVTVWRRIGPYLQVMDPAGGRRWIHREAFAKELYLHPFRLSQEDWQVWMRSNSYRESLEEQAGRFLSAARAEEVRTFLEAPTVERIRAVDGALRLVARTAQLAAKTPAWNDALFRRALVSAEKGELPSDFFAIAEEEDGVRTSGAVLLAPSESNRTPTASRPSSPSSTSQRHTKDESSVSLVRLLWENGGPLVTGLLIGIFTLSVATTTELMIYRLGFDATRLFTTLGSKAAAGLALGSLAALLLALEFTTSAAAATLGRQLELRLRMRTLLALPRVEDHFVRSRPTTDLAYRAHNLVTGGQLPSLLLSGGRAVGDLLVTLVAIGWLGLEYLLPVLLGGAALGLSLWLSRSRLRELDTRNQIHASRLLTFFLDALRGSRPLRLHGYQDSFRAEQQRELTLWRATGDTLSATTAGLEALNGAIGLGLLLSVFAVFLSGRTDGRAFILLVFWAFRIPPAIRTLIALAADTPVRQLALSRLLEVTTYASSEAPEARATTATSPESDGVALSFRGACVTANRSAVLRDVSLDIAPGERIAIVGRSGSGKSSLMGLLLGFQRLSAGEVRVDGAPLGGDVRRRLLEQTLWVNPAVVLWNRTIRENVDYAVEGLARRPFLEMAEATELLDVLNHMARGLDTPVGPEGGLISGGEGQRIQLARGVHRANVRLVILDEAFRGLEREVRERLVGRLRSLYRGATAFVVTHDIRSALDFPRVLVIEEGQVVEDGSPSTLLQNPSHLRRLLEAERRALEELWGRGAWRHVRVAEGTISDDAPHA